MKVGPGKASVITGVAALGTLCLAAAGAAAASALGLGSWSFSLLGLIGMVAWGAHIVGIGFGVEALRSRTQDRRMGLAGLLLNLGSLAFWLGLVPVALS